MIGFLRGTIEHLTEKVIVLLTAGGVGYEVIPCGSLLAEVKQGESATICIRTIVREQEITLYGFAAADERTLFDTLLGVSGIGPKVALSIVSTPIPSFLSAVESADIAVLTKLPGIGKKTAQRLVLELQGKLELTPEAAGAPRRTQSVAEATDALIALGYDRRTVEHALADASPTDPAETIIRQFLKQNA